MGDTSFKRGRLVQRALCMKAYSIREREVLCGFF